MTDTSLMRRIAAVGARAALVARILPRLWGTRRLLREISVPAGDGGDFDHARLVPEYYDRCTNLYRLSWGDQFHFAPFRNGESLAEANAALERLICERAGVRPGNRVLDVGCGIGGPACHIAGVTQARVVGLNICRSQIAIGRRLVRREGLQDAVDFVAGDAMQLPFAHAALDAVLSFEAICHVPRRDSVYRECARVLKPGGMFCGTDWAWVRPQLPSESGLCDDLCRLHAMPRLLTIEEIGSRLKDAGFEVLRLEDLAAFGKPERPWWEPLADRIDRPFLRGWGWIDDLVRGGRALLAGGRIGLFTPLCSWVARKPG